MQSKSFMKKLCIGVTLCIFLLKVNTVQAQYTWNSDSLFKAGKPNSGRIWGYAFGDYYYKAHTDTLNRGGSNQYTEFRKTGMNSRCAVFI